FMVTAPVPQAQRSDPTAERQFATRLESRIAGESGVSLSAIGAMNFAGEESRIQRLGDTAPLPQGAVPFWVSIGPGFFETVQTHTVRGRAFRDADAVGQERVAIVNSAAAARLWPGDEPVGQMLQLTRDSAHAELVRIVGVVEDSKLFDLPLNGRPVPILYRPFAQSPVSLIHVFVRNRGNPARLVAALQQDVHILTGEAISEATVRSMDNSISSELSIERFRVSAVGIAGLVSLLVVAIALYGSIAHAVLQRTREIGIRMALGGSRSAIIWLVVRRTLIMTLVGLVGGCLISVELGHVLLSVWQVSSGRPVATLAISAITIGVVGAAASWLPARHATKIDPVTAMRTD
ncbi:MAG: FtsX-like permease family protein, partial [Gemmatimonadaceae bacterium]